MKRIFSLSIIVLIFSLLLTGCMKDKVADDITNYMNNQMPTLNIFQENIVNALNDIAKDEAMDTDTFIKKLKDEIIVNSNKLIEESKKIVIETEEVKSIHAKYIAAMTKQNSGLVLMLEGLENDRNVEKLSKSTTLLAESDVEYKAYVSETNALALEHGLTVKE